MPQDTLDRRYTYADLEHFPDDGFRRELIDGELIVTPSPRLRHQAVVREVLVELTLWTRQHGGHPYLAPLDVKFSEETVLEPDVLLVLPQREDRLQERFVLGAPDLVVEVSSPSTRHLDLVRKRRVYERFGVPEYWFVDLDGEQVQVYRIAQDRYDRPQVLQRGDALTSPLLTGFSLPVAQLLDR